MSSLPPWSVSSVFLLTDVVRVTWAGEEADDDYPFVYLRDHCRCRQCFHPVSKGRLARMVNLDFDIRAREASLKDGKVKEILWLQLCTNSTWYCKLVRSITFQVVISWADGHESRFEPEWLWRRSFSPARSSWRARPARMAQRTFLGAGDRVPQHSYREVMEHDSKLLQWLKGG